MIDIFLLARNNANQARNAHELQRER